MIPYPTFDEYVEAMRPYTANITARRAHPHPYLEREDLVAEAHLALWEIFRRYGDEKPWEDLCRLGNTAIVRACVTAYRRSRRFGAPRPAALLSLDAPLDRRDGRPSSLRLGQTLATSQAPGQDEEGLWDLVATALSHVAAGLSVQGRRVLAELTAPRRETLEDGRVRWTTGTRPWATVRTAVLAHALDLSKGVVRKEVENIERAVRRELQTRYREEPENTPHTRREQMVTDPGPVAPSDPYTTTAPAGKKTRARRPPRPRRPGQFGTLKGKALRAARKKAGICTACGKRKARPKKTECQPCTDYQKKWNQEKKST